MTSWPLALLPLERASNWSSRVFKRYLFQVWVCVSCQYSSSHMTKKGLREYLTHKHEIPHKGASNQGNLFIMKEIWQWAYIHGIKWSYHITAPQKGSQAYRLLKWPTKDTANVPAQRQEWCAIYPLGCSICTDSKLCFQLGLRTHGFKNQKVKTEMIPYLPSYPVIHWKSPVDSQTLGSTELEVLGTLARRYIKDHTWAFETLCVQGPGDKKNHYHGRAN